MASSTKGKNLVQMLATIFMLKEVTYLQLFVKLHPVADPISSAEIGCPDCQHPQSVNENMTNSETLFPSDGLIAPGVSQ